MSGPARLGSCIENPSEAHGQPRPSELCRVVTFFFFLIKTKTKQNCSGPCLLLFKYVYIFNLVSWLRRVLVVALGSSVFVAAPGIFNCGV